MLNTPLSAQFTKKAKFFIALPLVAVAACGSYDLGNAESKSVSLTDDQIQNPDFGVIKPIVAMKCDNCHARNPGKFAPGDVPKSVKGLSESETAFLKWLPASKYRMSRTYDHLAGDDQPMPPKFGTPLSDREKQAMDKYFELNAQKYKDYCTGYTTSKTYNDVKSIVAGSCATVGCHPVGSRYGDFSSDVKFLAHKIDAIVYINQNSMPKNSNGLSTGSRTDLLNYLCTNN